MMVKNNIETVIRPMAEISVMVCCYKWGMIYKCEGFAVLPPACQAQRHGGNNGSQLFKK